MDEDENNDDNVWNAAGVILDIDSGMLNEIIYLFFFFSWQNYYMSNTHRQFLKLILSGLWMC